MLRFYSLLAIYINNLNELCEIASMYPVVSPGNYRKRLDLAIN